MIFSLMVLKKPKCGGQKYFKIMAELAQTMKRATNAIMAYIPCCSIVLMKHNKKDMGWISADLKR